MGTTREIIKRALADDAFRRRLLQDPRSAIEKELGIELPAGVAVRVHENTDSVINLVLPAAAETADAPGLRPLSNDELEQVAGGMTRRLVMKGGDTFGALSQCCNTSSFCAR